MASWSIPDTIIKNNNKVFFILHILLQKYKISGEIRDNFAMKKVGQGIILKGIRVFKGSKLMQEHNANPVFLFSTPAPE